MALIECSFTNLPPITKECAWCGDEIDDDRPYRIYDSGQVQYLCDSARCWTRHHAYNEQCVCGWWHSDQHCPKCGRCLHLGTPCYLCHYPIPVEVTGDDFPDDF